MTNTPQIRPSQLQNWLTTYDSFMKRAETGATAPTPHLCNLARGTISEGINLFLHNDMDPDLKRQLVTILARLWALAMTRVTPKTEDEIVKTFVRAMKNKRIPFLFDSRFEKIGRDKFLLTIKVDNALTDIFKENTFTSWPGAMQSGEIKIAIADPRNQIQVAEKKHKWLFEGINPRLPIEITATAPNTYFLVSYRSSQIGIIAKRMVCGDQEGQILETRPEDNIILNSPGIFRD